MMSPLKGSTVRRESLTEAQRAQMLALMQLCYAGVSPERFAQDLDGKQYVILLHARRGAELVGFSTLRVSEERAAGRVVEVVYSGDTVIHPDCGDTRCCRCASDASCCRASCATRCARCTGCC